MILMLSLMKWRMLINISSLKTALDDKDTYIYDGLKDTN